MIFVEALQTEATPPIKAAPRLIKAAIHTLTFHEIPDFPGEYHKGSTITQTDMNLDLAQGVI